MEPTLIYETLHGSRAYGLAREESDEDFKGVVVGPPRWYFGYRGGPEQVELGPDHVRFELRKLLKLAANANPTVLELFFTESEDHRTVTAEGERLLEARELFLTRRVGQSFGGYAMGQLKRIRTHRQWLLSPPAAPPTRGEFGLPQSTLVPRDQLGAAETLLEQGATELELSPNFLDVLGREKRYRSARQRWQQFVQWKTHRNKKRSALEAKHGYDTKHAMHLVRLQRMGAEILETQRVNVRREDRDELLAIRDGAWSYDALVEAAETNAARITRAFESSTLPSAPDEDRIESLGISLIEAVRSRSQS